MATDPNISDEHLSAFIDGQLDADEKGRILTAINDDRDLSRRACDLRRLRELVQHAYDAPPPPPVRRAGGIRSPLLGRAVAASLLLALGGAVGWFAHAHQADPLNLQAMYLDKERAFQTASVSDIPARGERKILLHLSSSEPEKLERALETAERLLSTYRAAHQPVELELVTNAGGLDLLRADVSPYADRVRELQRRYDNLTFLACQTALDQLRRDRRLTPDMLPETLLTPNALEEIIGRLQQGWMYISV